jgi:hypothetical protein
VSGETVSERLQRDVAVSFRQSAVSENTKEAL